MYEVDEELSSLEFSRMIEVDIFGFWGSFLGLYWEGDCLRNLVLIILGLKVSSAFDFWKSRSSVVTSFESLRDLSFRTPLS